MEHAKAHRTKKEKKEMSHFGKFVTEGNEKADDLAKARRAVLHEGFVVGARAKPVQQERSVRSLAVRSQLSLLGGGMERM